MTRLELPTSGPTELKFSKAEQQALKDHVQNNIKKLEKTSAKSVLEFFRTIELFDIRTLPYSMQHVLLWNNWVLWQKRACVGEFIEWNGSPKISLDKLEQFLTHLVRLGLLEESSTQISKTTYTTSTIIGNKNPT